MKGAASDTPDLPAVLVPIKQFDQAKLRLSDELSADQRSALAQAMAENVIAAAQPLPTFVVCDDSATQQWATNLGAGVIKVASKGLNEAITEAVRRLCDDPATVDAASASPADQPSYTHALIAHGDLPLAKSLAGLTEPNKVLIVPDRHLDGTNVMSLPLRTDFKFHYGIGSLHAHISEALRLGIEVIVRRVAELECDVDTVADLPDAHHLLAPQPQSQPR